MSKSLRNTVRDWSNKIRGKMGELAGQQRDEAHLYTTEQTGIGSDRRRRKTDLFGNPTGPWEYVEVKTGRARLSPRQTREKKKRGKNYKVEREGLFDWPFR